MLAAYSEEQIVLYLARLQPRDCIVKDAGKAGSNDSGTFDFDKVIRLASMNGVSALLYRNIGALPGVPPNILSRLENIYHTTFHSNARHMAEMLRLVRLLQGGGVGVIPLKGSLASDIIFGDIGLYPTSDIDLLVRPNDLARTKKILAEAGYNLNGALDESDQMLSSYHLSYHNGVYVVEVHWNLVMRYFEAPPDFWWEETMETVLDGTEITLLSPERYLLYAIFRLFSRNFRPLRFLVFVSGLISKYRKEMDWEKLLHYAGEYKMRRLTIFTLKLVNDMLGVDVPAYLADRDIYGYDFLKGVIISGIFREVRRTHLRMALFTVLLDNPLDAGRVLLRRVFPPASEIRLRYGLSEKSGLLYAYYVLNPFILFLRKF